MREPIAAISRPRGSQHDSDQKTGADRKADLNIDPFLGLEHIRRDILDLSKPAFYGPDGIVHDLPVTQLSARRKGVRKSDLDRVLAARTRAPRKVSDNLPSTK